MQFPSIDPVLFSYGPIMLGWYVPMLAALAIGGGIAALVMREKLPERRKAVMLDLQMWLVGAAALLAAGVFVFRDTDHEMAIGPLSIRWYAMAYLVGFVLGWQYALFLARQNPKGPTAELYDEFLTWAVIGTVLGGRIGYVLFYQPEYYFAHPFGIFEIWHGGMSFHGGMLGVTAAAWLFVNRRKIGFLAFTDILACVVPIGLGLGRLANFVNAELYGRITDVSWGVVFPCRDGVPLEQCPGPLPRHPSQLYEAFLEGLVLFIIMFIIAQRPKWRARPGFISGCFLLLYGLFRFTVEFFREPDIQLGLLIGGSTMGQLLCLPMMLFGLYLILRSERRAIRRE